MGRHPVIAVSLILLSMVMMARVAVVYADAVGAEMLLLTTHVSDHTIQLEEHYSRKLSSDGRFVVTPGFEIYYDKELSTEVLSLDVLRSTVGAYYDSVNHKSGYLAMLMRWQFRSRERLQISFGLGPALIFRESWNRIPAYRDDGYYNESDWFLPGYQYKWIVAGDLDLQYQLAPDLQGVWSIIPGIPYVITQSLGLRWAF